MAAVVATVTNVDSTRDTFVVYGTITLTGSYPASSTGDTLSFKGFDQIKSSSPPLWVDVVEQPATPSATAPSGIVWQFAPGTTQANGKLLAMTTGAAAGDGLQQLGNVTYASVNAANLVFRATFNKFI
jgi:hypothetical protein